MSRQKSHEKAKKLLIQGLLDKAIDAKHELPVRYIRPAITETAIHLLPLSERVQLLKQIFQVFNPSQASTMTFFVLYDIENNKIRTHVAKYLLRLGCIRVQKSVFLAKMPRDQFINISQTLSEIQISYDNHDSIMLVPVPEDDVKSMHIIGADIDTDLVLKTQGTLFF